MKIKFVHLFIVFLLILFVVFNISLAMYWYENGTIFVHEQSVIECFYLILLIFDGVFVFVASMVAIDGGLSFNVSKKSLMIEFEGDEILKIHFNKGDSNNEKKILD